MKILKTLFVGMIIVSLVVATCPVVYAKGGNSGNNGNQGQGQIKGNRGKAVGHARNAEKRQDAVKRARKQADIRANRPEKPDRLATKLDRGRSAEHFGKKGPKDQVKGLFKALGKARWAHNPHDTRGQGNMGKPDMIDPYGHDKESGREKGERSRVTQTSDSAYEPGDVIALGDPMLSYYARTLIQYYEAEGNMSYAAYLREFYGLVDVDLDNFIAPETQFTFKLTVVDGVIAEKIIGVNYIELVDIHALGEQLNDGGYDYWLRGVVDTRIAAEENPRLGLTAYATTFELYLSNYLISRYPEIAQQIVEGTYQF